MTLTPELLKQRAADRAAQHPAQSSTQLITPAERERMLQLSILPQAGHLRPTTYQQPGLGRILDTTVARRGGYHR